jgi:dihydropteroate synthase
MNAYTVEVKTPDDARRFLSQIGADERDIRNADAFLNIAIKLEGVDAGTANALKRTLESLGGAAAMRREAAGSETGETDLILSASRKTLETLAAGMEGERPAVGAGIRSCIAAGNRIIRWGARELDFRSRIYVMGILNSTPDSFYPASRNPDLRDAINSASRMIEAGADILDVGGESSRPGSDPVPADEEARRVVPVIREIRAQCDILISVDTSKKDVAERALDAGADMINDITALRGDPELAGCAAKRGVPVVLMHMRGDPKTMQQNPVYGNAVSEIFRELAASISRALEAGISRSMIIVDPGIGFGKRVRDNLALVRELSSLKSLHVPIMIGVSRKSFIGEILGQPVEKRLTGTIAANTISVINGADIVRVHDVGEAVEMAKIVDSVRRTEE